MMTPYNQTELLRRYEAGPAQLQAAFACLTPDQFLARPIAGVWITHEVVGHLADSEMLFAERAKRILAEGRPPLLFADPQLFLPALTHATRDVPTEIDLITLVRRQLAAILRAVPVESFAREGIHNPSGPCTLEQVITNAISHLEHHVRFIHDKRRALAAPKPRLCRKRLAWRSVRV
jgi:hypothetical protein